MPIRWKRATGGFVLSRDGRWQIVPLYCGCTRPQLYDLLCDGHVVSGYHANQREAKESAEWLVTKASSRSTGSVPVNPFSMGNVPVTPLGMARQKPLHSPHRASRRAGKSSRER